MIEKDTELIQKEEVLSPKKLQAIALLLEGKSNVKVAEELGIDRATIARWRKEPGFTEFFQLQVAELKINQGNKLLNLSRKALDVIEKSLDDGNLKAAVFVINRQDRLEEIANRNHADLPRIYVELKPAEHNYTVSADELLEINKKLGVIEPEGNENQDR